MSDLKSTTDSATALPEQMKHQLPPNPPPPPSRKLGQRLMLVFAGTGVFFLAAATLNPSQEHHLSEIASTFSRKLYPQDQKNSIKLYALSMSSSYNNYFIFSTITFGGNNLYPAQYLLSYGFFGAVKTTDRINTTVADINKFVDEFKSPAAPEK